MTQWKANSYEEIQNFHKCVCVCVCVCVCEDYSKRGSSIIMLTFGLSQEVWETIPGDKLSILGESYILWRPTSNRGKFLKYYQFFNNNNNNNLII